MSGSRVEIARNGDGFVLLRNGEPYTIRGVGGRQNLEQAAKLGANSLRTWGGQEAPLAFEQASRTGLTVFLGIWLSHDAADYSNEVYKQSKRLEVSDLVRRYKNHPQLLVWALGNEIQLGADVPSAWQFVEELAQIVRGEDPNHPIATVTAHAPTQVLNHIVQYAPTINLLGVNSYAGLPVVPRDMDASSYRGPFVITEWGPDGHWEVPLTPWGRPIEQNSTEKAHTYAERLRLIESWHERCFGSYAFLWGQKQERTPTWYGLFVEDRPVLGLHGEMTPQLEVVANGWQGRAEAHSAPAVGPLSLGGKRPVDGLIVTPRARLEALLEVADREPDSLQFIWELLKEPTELGQGGAHEERPERVESALEPAGQKATLIAPLPGEYRLFVYVLNGKGGVGTANFPFKVQ